MPTRILPGISAFAAARFPVAGRGRGPAMLIAVASLAALSVPATSGAAQLDPEDVMVEQFQSFCLDYYSSTQCAGAIRFILRTSGNEYFAHLDNDESKDGFLNQLARAIKGGETLLAEEALAAKAGD